MIQYVPSAPYPSVDHWEHPMSYHNLKLLDKDLQMREAKQHTNRNIKNVKTINNTKHKYKFEQSEKIILLLSGYVRQMYELYNIQIGAITEEIIRLYLWKHTSHSQKCIAATHLIASIIDRHINNRKNKCEFSNNNDFNILNYIFIRGGALRDCYLLRNIRDIDLTVNIYELSRAYLTHLIKYHKNHSKQSDSKCIFWRHYLNKYKTKNDYELSSDDDDDVQQLPFYPTYNENIDKILRYEHHIVTCDYLLNARFIVNILKQKHHLFKIQSRYFKLHWLVKVHGQYGRWNMSKSSNIKCDIVDETGNSDARYKTFANYGILTGCNDTITNIVSQIDAYNNEQKENVCISVPLYPFPTHLGFHDFTINSMHINLYQILINNHNVKSIDYNWECKIRKKYNINVINKYNVIGINDLNNKTIRAPLLNVINKETACFYFWRLVKLAQKFIYKIIGNIWKIDCKLMKHTIEHYHKWFNDELFEYPKHFANKFLKWNIDNTNDYIRRFYVFRHIKFENYFRRSLLEYTDFASKLTDVINNTLPYSHKVVLKTCFKQFRYPPLAITIDNNYNNIAKIHYSGSGKEFDS